MLHCNSRRLKFHFPTYISARPARPAWAIVAALNCQHVWAPNSHTAYKIRQSHLPPFQGRVCLHNYSSSPHRLFDVLHTRLFAFLPFRFPVPVISYESSSVIQRQPDGESWCKRDARSDTRTMRLPRLETPPRLKPSLKWTLWIFSIYPKLNETRARPSECHILCSFALSVSNKGKDKPLSFSAHEFDPMVAYPPYVCNHFPSPPSLFLPLIPRRQTCLTYLPMPSMHCIHHTHLNSQSVIHLTRRVIKNYPESGKCSFKYLCRGKATDKSSSLIPLPSDLSHIHSWHNSPASFAR